MNQTQLEAIMNEPGLTKKRAVISIAIAVICHAVWISVVLHMCCCYNPDLSKVRYTCSVTHPLCPDGQECIEGWCGGPPPSVSPPPDMMAAPADGSMPPTPDMASECPMCKSGRCKLLRGGVMGCYFTPGTSASLQCQGTHRIAIVLPFATDTDCQWANDVVGGTEGRWLGFPRGWSTSTGAPPTTAWWNNQPITGASYRFISVCGAKSDTAWTELNGYKRAIRCMSGQPGDLPSDVTCPRGATPGDADYDSVTSSDPMTGVLCVRR